MNPLTTLPARRVLALLLLLGAACLLPADGRQPGGQAGGQPDPNPKKLQAAGEPKSEGTLPESVVKSLAWRCVGPANMSGRITAISVYEADPTIYWVATASGGLLKTTNNGVTFEHQFDKEEVVSIGDVCVAPSNKDVVWVGTGEANPRNSVSYGNGVYKSTDGGKTWKNMGLKDSFQIGKILIHPKNPDIVWVGALGRLYGPSKERGVYKTTDGGQSWKQVWYKDDRTGVIDMAMHPTDPDTVLIAGYERKRDGFDAHLAKEWPDPYDWYDPVVRFGENAGIYRTADGGKTFEKITKGLPPGKLGRIGLDWHRADPKIVFAIVDCEDIGKGDAPKKKGGGKGFAGFAGDDADGGVRVTMVQGDSPAAKAGLEINDLITAVNGKAVKSMEDYRSEVADLNAGDKMTLTVKRADDTKKLEVTLGESPFKGGGQPGGGKKDRPYLAQLGGQAPNAQDEQGPDGWKTGGVYRSDDAGKTWTRVNSLNPRPMYFSVVKVDPTDPKYVYVLGVSQYKSVDGGKTFSANAGKGVHADGHAMWISPKDGRHLLIGCDGGFYVSYDRASNWDHLNTTSLGQFYHVAVDTKRPYWLYGGLQDNGSWGLPSVGLKGRGPVNEDVVSIGGGDGFVCRVDPNDPDLVYSESQGGAISRRNLRTGERAVIRPVVPGGGKGKGKGGGQAESPYKFNWNTPFILSHHNSRIFYSAGNFVFKSLDRGDDLKVISPEIPLSTLGTATALSESPKNPDVLWVGTDDGALWITKNGGKDWNEISHLVPMPGPRCVATIEASKFKEGRCYVCFDAHRSNDDQPYVFVTEDFGASWAPIRSNLPGFGSTRCLREDLFNENLLYCGTEFHLYASINRGASWTRINNNLPTVAIHEVAVHPTAGEIAVATHGRSLWILDVTALRQMKPDTFAKKVQLFKPNTATRWESLVSTGGTNRSFVGTNPTPGAHIYFWLAEKPAKMEVKVLDVEGETIAKLTPPAKAGLNKVTWSTFRQLTDQPKKGGGKGGGGGGGGFPGFQQQARVPAGTYRVVLTVDGQEFTTTVRVEADPNVPPRGVAEDEEPFVDPRKFQ
jgi:photosystem II stability/assembly factor-like uncharacterized protein